MKPVITILPAAAAILSALFIIFISQTFISAIIALALTVQFCVASYWYRHMHVKQKNAIVSEALSYASSVVLFVTLAIELARYGVCIGQNGCTHAASSLLLVFIVLQVPMFIANIIFYHYWHK
jgi:hypothetical protein